VFSVIDTGRGIKTEDQHRLFGAFEQIEGSTNERSPGTGLGLHISQTLAETLGATISFESEYGVGSTFRLEVPDQAGEMLAGTLGVGNTEPHGLCSAGP